MFTLFSPMKKTCLLTLVFSVFLSSCSREDKADEITCSNMQLVTLSSNSPVTIGETISFSAPEVGGYRIYSWTGPNNFTSQEPENTISDAKLQNEGWYHLHLSNPTCTAKTDSVYIDIKLQQGTPSCTIGNNTCQFNNQGTDTYSSVHELFDPTYNFRTLEASGFATMEVMFHQYWNTHEPEDGIYTTVNMPSFGQLDNNYNKVFVSTIKGSILFVSAQFQNVYVSHVNGKLRVRFCSLAMGGNNGSMSFSTLASATLTEQ